MLCYRHPPSLPLCVGEIKLSAIQKNLKKVMREEFSLFSLGIGFDVDYDFLERIAMENRGAAQRIYTSHDASDQIRVQQTPVPKTPIHPSLPNPASSCITTPPPSPPSALPPL